ncbi:MAG: AIPR family protein [Prosthecobacter sp.]
MAKNDILLLDQIVSEVARDRSISLGDAFQDFAISEVLKDYDLAPDEIEMGIVDGRNDGGIDAWYTFLDGDLLCDPDDLTQKRGASVIDVWILTAKHHDAFKQEPVVHLYATILDLLDLAKDESHLIERYNDELLSCRDLFKKALIKTARGSPRVRFRLCYLSRGDRELLGETVTARSDALVREVYDLLSNCEVSFDFIGAAELLAANRKIKNFSSVIKFEEGPLSRGGAHYLGLSTLANYLSFISDANGGLRRYLFESNVRDFMGGTFVNRSIMSTLKHASSSEEEDFWWLNNGVTVIADKATLVGKELHLENVQIVNGLQTTETVFQHLVSRPNPKDDRCILVKVLVTPQKALADRIILATNNQNKVDFSSLRATDKVQRDIEDILATKNWFYDRRKNYYLNHGKPPSRIVSMTQMSWCVLSLLHGQPHQCNRSRPKYMQSESAYKKIFSEDFDLTMYLASVEFCKSIEAAMLSDGITDSPYEVRSYAAMFRFLYAHLYAAAVLKTDKRRPLQIIEIWKRSIDTALIQQIHSLVLKQRVMLRESGRSLRKMHRNEEFQSELTAVCLTTVFKTSSHGVATT